MTGLDTNVLARYIVQDDPAEAALATALIEGRCTAADPGRIALVVLCELVWVLRSGYRFDRRDVVRVLDMLLKAAELDIEEPLVARLALSDYRAGPGDYADYLIAHLNHAAGTGVTATFDRRAARHRLFKLLV